MAPAEDPFVPVEKDKTPVGPSADLFLFKQISFISAEVNVFS